MKRILAGVLATSALVLGVPSQVQAANWQDVAWNDMRKLAPAGAAALGRSYTLRQIERTCQYLSRGVAADVIIDEYLALAAASAQSTKQRSEIAAYSLSIAVVAGKRLCPKFLPEIWRSMNR